jgi:hypothetical protein
MNYFKNIENFSTNLEHLGILNTNLGNWTPCTMILGDNDGNFRVR